MDEEDFVDLFVEEVGEHLETLQSQLLALEEDNWQPEIVNSLMRAAHTIKGAAMLMNFDPMAQVAHALEDRLRLEEKRERPVPPQMIDLFLAGAKVIDEMVREAIECRDFSKIEARPEWIQLTETILEAEFTEERTASPPPAPEPPAEPPPAPASKELALDASPPEKKARKTPADALSEEDMEAMLLAALDQAQAPTEAADPSPEGSPERAPEAKSDAPREPPPEEAPAKSKKKSAKKKPSKAKSPAKKASKKGAKKKAKKAAKVQSEPAPQPTREAEGLPAPMEGAPEGPAPPPPAAPVPAPLPSRSSAVAAASTKSKSNKSLKEQIKIPVEKVDQLNDLVGELLIYQAKLEQKEESLRDMTRRLENLVAMSERARLIGLSPLPPEVQDIQEDLSEYVEELSGDLVELNYLSAEIRRRSLQIRMLPAQTLLQEFRLAVRDLNRRLKKEATLVVEGGEIELDKRLLEELRPAILHIIRNCMDHGIEVPEARVAAGKPRGGEIRLTVRVEGARVRIHIQDDGKGMDAEKIRARAVQFGIITPETAATISDEEALYLVMQPGFSTSETVTDVSGRGVGMDVVRTQVEDLKGSIEISTDPGRGSRLILDLPLTLSTAQVLMVEVSGQILAIPIGYVEETLLLDPTDVFREGGHPVFRLRDRTISLYEMESHLSGLTTKGGPRTHFLPVIILQGRGQRVGFKVGRFLEQSEVVVKTLGTFIESVAFISGATILGDGKPALILDVPDLLSSLALKRAPTRSGSSEGTVAAGPGLLGKAPRILVVDDSITTRALQKGILENQGFEVHTAASGSEALQMLQDTTFDLMLTDVEMPGMSGFELTEQVRRSSDVADLPIVICSVKGTEEDRLRGMALGAQAYLVKREFDQNEFCAVVRRLIS